MRIKRFVTRDMRQAIREIREEMGPDAVILSSRKTDEGLETTAAIDYEEVVADAPAPRASRPAMPPTSSFEREPAPASTPSQPAPPARRPAPPAPAMRRESGSAERAARPARPPAAPIDSPPSARPALPASPVAEHTVDALYDEIRALRGVVTDQLGRLAWNDFERKAPVRAEVVTALLAMGIGKPLAERVAKKTPADLDPPAARRRALELIAAALRAPKHDLFQDGGVVALLGSTGVGKTTSAAKIAARFTLRHGSDRVALITTDNYRVGASEQLRTFARIMGVAFRVVDDEQELRQAIRHFYDRRLVVIDTAGMSQRDRRFSEQIDLIASGSPAVRKYLVLSATTQRAGLDEVTRAFGASRIDGCIVTKLDECTQLGPALSVALEHRLPLGFVCEGQRVPEDFRTADPRELVSKAAALARIEAAAGRTPASVMGGGVDAGS